MVGKPAEALQQLCTHGSCVALVLFATPALGPGGDSPAIDACGRADDHGGPDDQ